MATAGDDGPFEVDVRRIASSVADSYRYMDISTERYVAVVLLPSFGFLACVLVGLALFPLPLAVSLPATLLGVLAAAGAVVYPKVVADSKRKQIRERFHLFLTHITVLSMTNIERVEIFRTLAKVDEYGALAEEMGRIVALVDTWNQSLDDACRRRSKHVTSELLSDFLERLAYTVGAGQQIDEFLVDEQESIIKEFVIRYESDLAKLDVLKELYLSMMLSTTFILVFATVLPLLLGLPPTLLVGGVIAMFALVQAGFLFVIHTVAPQDPVWLAQDTKRSPARKVWPALGVGIGLTLLASGGILALAAGYTPFARDVLPMQFYLAIPLTPLLVPAIVMRREEQKVTNRDEGFPSFIRALGGVESVKQTSTVNVLESLRRKDFGALTDNVDGLYKRLNTRIDSQAAWRLFAAETGSYLIQKFGEMYVVGRRMGGDPKQLGQIISTNISEVLRVREQREQATSTLIGVIYGITAASIFSAFIGLAIAEQMLAITENITTQNNEMMSMLFHTGSYDIEFIEYLLLMVVLLNALMSSLMIRLTDRGHAINALLHFVMLTWVGVVVATATQLVVGGLITV